MDDQEKSPAPLWFAIFVRGYGRGEPTVVVAIEAEKPQTMIVRECEGSRLPIYGEGVVAIRVTEKATRWGGSYRKNTGAYRAPKDCCVGRFATEESARLALTAALAVQRIPEPGLNDALGAQAAAEEAARIANAALSEAKGVVSNLRGKSTHKMRAEQRRIMERVSPDNERAMREVGK